ncbi:MAG: Wzy polymerase domain-containing protein [Gallionella sp.]|nr:Wzy polymerase domain-containing protein [Gallionella sp.]MCK9355292.1 Wzy polymerase domain-containing protein [Gallionella sp.]
MLRDKLQSLRLTHISLALVGLMWVSPFLHYLHRYPLTTFYQEWWSALLGVGALTLLVGRAYWQRPEIPRIVQLPVGLAAIALLQLALGKLAYFDQALLFTLYLLFAALLMMLGAWLCDIYGFARLAQVLAICLLIGAELSTAIAVLQHFRWSTPFDSVIVAKVSVSVYGNLAQPNHFADYIALGLISLGLLHQLGLKGRYAVLLALPLLLTMTLSGSRSTWLYLLSMTVLAAWWGWRDAAQRPLLRYSLSLLAGFGAMHILVQLPFMAGAGGSVDTMQRLFGEDATGSIRLYLWRESWLMFGQSPWLGVGFGQFAWHHLQLLPLLQPGNIQGLYNNAHNLVFQLAAETGIAGLLVLFAALAMWLNGLRRAPLDAAHWWGYAILGVLAIHSLLEYPLWYTYFVAVAAILLGALDETRYRLELRAVGRLSVAAMLLLGLLTLLQLRASYVQLEQVLRMRPASAADQDAFKRVRDGLVAIHGGSLLSPYAELFMSSMIEVSEDRKRDKLELNTRVMGFVPVGHVVYRQALLLAQNDMPQQAKVVLEQAIWSYPAEFDASRQRLEELAEKEPARYAALLEFALQKEQEYASAVRH